MSQRGYTRGALVREVALLAIAIIFSVPIYLAVSMSLKTDAQAWTDPIGLPNPVTLENYTGDVWLDGEFARALLNSFTITAGAVVCLVIIGSLCAYVLARRESRLSGTLYFLFVLGIILPPQMAILPLFTAFRNLGLTGSAFGMVVFYTGQFLPLVVFLYAGFIRTLPRDFEEAASVDGAGRFRIFATVVLPLMGPITATVAVLSSVSIWNDFFVPLIFLSGSEAATVPLTLYSFVGENASDWSLIMAGVMISVAPAVLFYVFAQRQLVEGFAGGIKG